VYLNTIARNPVIELQDEIQLQEHANETENVIWTMLYIEGYDSLKSHSNFVTLDCCRDGLGSARVAAIRVVHIKNQWLLLHYKAKPL
jgi:hypothetical protein